MKSSNMARPWVRHLLHIVAFCLVLWAAVLVVGHYLMPSSNRYLSGYTAGGILGEDFDTIDVLVLGDSNAAQGISPMQWYNDYGVTGYTYASGWLSIYSMYYRLASIYEEQAPRVVVLCTGPAYNNALSTNYFEQAVSDIAGELLPLVRFHDNWKQITLDNFMDEHDYSWRDTNKGYTAVTTVGANMSGFYMYDTGTREPIPWMDALYMRRIADLCAANGSELLLITVPAASSWNLARHNAVQAFADENGLTYIDFNMTEYDPGIDWHTDTPDGGAHLNVLGAEKLTAALGTYLTEHYDLPDHRGQTGYEDWDADGVKYAEEIAAKRAENEDAAAYQLEELAKNNAK